VRYSAQIRVEGANRCRQQLALLECREGAAQEVGCPAFRFTVAPQPRSSRGERPHAGPRLSGLRPSDCTRSSAALEAGDLGVKPSRGPGLLGAPRDVRGLPRRNRGRLLHHKQEEVVAPSAAAHREALKGCGQRKSDLRSCGGASRKVKPASRYVGVGGQKAGLANRRPRKPAYPKVSPQSPAHRKGAQMRTDVKIPPGGGHPPWNILVAKPVAVVYARCDDARESPEVQAARE